MTRVEIIEELEKLKDAIAVNKDSEITDYARERAYMSVDNAIELLIENYDNQ